MLTYNELIQQRRSIREFEDKKIDPTILNEILHETCLAPSASNLQPWKFIIIQDQALIKKLSEESKKNLLHYIEKNPFSPVAEYERTLRNPKFNVFFNSPCLVLIVGKKESGGFLHCDCSLAAAYFMFAATSRGLGTCWIGLGGFIKDQTLKTTIGLPNDHEIIAPLIIGYPKRIPIPTSRKEPIILKNIEAA